MNFSGLGGLAQMVERVLSMREVAASMPVSTTKRFENFLTFSEKKNSAYKVCAKYARNSFQKISVWRSPNWAISAELFQAQNMPCKKTFTIIKCSKLIFKHIYRILYCMWRWTFQAYRGLAQMVERALRIREVAGSTPASSTYSCENIFTFTDKTMTASMASG